MPDLSIEDFEIVALGQRHVRTAEGAEFYHLPIGAPITKKDELLAKAEHGVAAVSEMAQKESSSGGRSDGKIGTNATGADYVLNKPSYPNLEKGQRAENGSDLAAKNEFDHNHPGQSVETDKDGNPKPLNLKLVKPTIEGNQHFNVGTGSFSAPAGSKLIKPEGNDELSYVLTPDGDVHAFNENGEVTIPDTLQGIFQSKFAGDLSEDPHYSEHPFDSVSASHGIDTLQPGDKLLDAKGEHQFTKQDDGTFKHASLNATVAEKDLKPLYDKGQLVPEKNKKNDVAEDAFKDTKASNFAAMSNAEFEKALNGMPNGTVLNHTQAGDVTKGDDGKWHAEDTPSVAMSPDTLFAVRKDLTIKNSEPEKPAEVNPLTGENPAAVKAAEDAKDAAKIGESPDLNWLKNTETGSKVEFIDKDGGVHEWTKGPTGNWNHSSTNGDEGTGLGLSPEDMHKFSGKGESLKITGNGDGSEGGKPFVPEKEPENEPLNPLAPKSSPSEQIDGASVIQRQKQDKLDAQKLSDSLNKPDFHSNDMKKNTIVMKPERSEIPGNPEKTPTEPGEEPAPEAPKLTPRQQAPLSIVPGQGSYKKKATPENIKNAAEGDAVLAVFGQPEDGEKVEYEFKNGEWVNPQDSSDKFGPLAMEGMATQTPSENGEEPAETIWAHNNNQPVAPELKPGEEPTPDWVKNAAEGDQVKIGSTTWTKTAKQNLWNSQNSKGAEQEISSATLMESTGPNSPHDTSIIKSGDAVAEPKAPSKPGEPLSKEELAGSPVGTKVTNEENIEFTKTGDNQWASADGMETKMTDGALASLKAKSNAPSKPARAKKEEPEAKTEEPAVSVPKNATPVKQGEIDSVPDGSDVYTQNESGVVGHFTKTAHNTFEDHMPGMGFTWNNANIDNPDHNTKMFAVSPADKEPEAKPEEDLSKLDYKKQMDLLHTYKPGTQFKDDTGSTILTKQDNGQWSEPGKTTTVSDLTALNAFHNGKPFEPKDDAEAKSILYPEGQKVSNTSALPVGTKLLNHYTPGSGSSTEAPDVHFEKTGENAWSSPEHPDVKYTDQQVSNNGSSLGWKLTIANNEKPETPKTEAPKKSISKSDPPQSDTSTLGDAKDWLNGQNPGTQLKWNDETVTKQSDGTWSSSEGDTGLTAENLKSGLVHGNYKLVPGSQEPTVFKVGDEAKGIDHLNAVAPGTALKYAKKGGTFSTYVKLDDGTFLTPGGQHMSSTDLKNATFKIDSLPNSDESKEDLPDVPKVDEPELSDAPDTQLVQNGPAYSKQQIKEAIDALEGHSGFQIKYGLNSLDSEHPLKDLEAVSTITDKAKELHPEMKPKQALITYLKEKGGFSTAAPKDIVEDENAPKINLGSRTPKAGVQGFDGGQYTQAEISDAINILEAHQGKVFKSELNKKGNKLGELDPNKLVGFDPDKTVTKQKFINLLKAKLNKETNKNLPTPEPTSLLGSDDLEEKPIGSQILFTPNFPDSNGITTPKTWTKIPEGKWENDKGEQVDDNFMKVIADQQPKGLGSLTSISEPEDLPEYAQTPIAVQAKTNEAAQLLVGQVPTEQQMKDLPVGSLVHAPASKYSSYKKVEPDGWTKVSEDGEPIGDPIYTSMNFISNTDIEMDDKYKYHVKSVPNGIQYNDSDLAVGKYSTEKGKAYMVVHADGTGVYVTSTGEVSPISAAKVKILHQQGMNTYGGVVDNAPSVAEKPKAVPKKKVPQGSVDLADGTYYLGAANGSSTSLYKVKGDQVEIHKDGAEPQTVPLSKIKTAYFNGKILDENGNSVLPKDHFGSAVMWNKPTTTTGLISAKEMFDNGELDNFFNPSTQQKLKESGLYINYGDVVAKLKKDNPSLPYVYSYYNSSGYNSPEWNEPAKAKIGEVLDNLLKNVNQEKPDSNTAAYFDWIGDGEAAYPQDLAGQTVSTYNLTSMTDFIKKASASFGGGKVIGVPAMNKYQKQKWIAAFKAGNFHSLYQIEVEAAADKNKSHPSGFLHPGFIDNKDTQNVKWGASVPGEVSAMQTIDGVWSDTAVSGWSPDEVDNYLIKAQMQNPEHLSLSEKRNWVTFHKSHQKEFTDGLSVLALNRKEADNAPMSEPPVWSDDIKPAKIYDSAFDDGPMPTSSKWSQLGVNAPHQWAQDVWKDDEPSPLPDLGIKNFKQWNEDPDLNQDVPNFDPTSGDFSVYTSQSQVHKYWNYVNDKHQEELAKPVYSVVKEVNQGQAHEVFIMQDQFGKQYVFKPVDSPAHKFRADVEDAANKLGKLFGFSTPSTQVMEVNGKTGLMQEFVPNVGSFAGENGHGLDMTSMSGKQLGQIAQEHVLDWILDNDDTHADNLLLKEDGGVVGIDKGRGLFVYGNWAGVTGDESAHSNAKLIYTQLYNGIKDGSISKEQADAAYFAAMKAATRIQKTNDESVKDLVLQGVANRTKWSPPDYMTHFDHKLAPTNADELVKAVLDRKAEMPDQIKAMWEGIYEKAGYTLPEPPPKLLGEEHLSGWSEPDTIAKAGEMKVWGAAPIHAAAGITNGHSLLWNEKVNGDDTTKGKLAVGSLTQKKFLSFLTPKASKASATMSQATTIMNFPDTHDWKSAQSIVGKDVTKHAVDKDYTPGLEEKLDEVTKQIEGDLAHWHPALANPDDPNELVKFPSGKLVPSGAIGQYKLALDHYWGQSEKAKDALATGEPTQKDDFTVYQPIPFKNEPQTFTKGHETYKELTNGQYLHSNSAAAAPAEAITVGALPDEVKNQENGWASATSTGGEAQSGPSYIIKDAGDYTGKLSDGGLKESDGNFGSTGHQGEEYEITLPTGEVINFRNSSSTATNKSQQGRVTFTLSSGDQSASLARIQNQLSLMGLDMDGAKPEDAETVYWRNMFGRVLGSNGGGAKIQAARAKLLGMESDLSKQVGSEVDWKNLIEAVGLSMGSSEEHDFWDELARDTFSDEKVSHWLSNDKHLPQYHHMDISNPENSTGMPYWNRIDVDPDELKKTGKLLAIGNSGKDDSLLKYITSGGMLSTEERLRVLGHFKAGMSSQSDQGTGGANSIFTRVTATDGNEGYVAWWNPSVLNEIGTYSFAGDMYGNTDNQPDYNKFNPVESLKQYKDGSNETMISNSLSLVDHMELMVFEDIQKRDEAIQRMKKAGLNEIRGLPIEERLIMRANLKKALEAVKKNWVNEL